MSKLLKHFTELFGKQPTALEAFLATRSLKTHSDVEFWTKYWEFRGL